VLKIESSLIRTPESITENSLAVTIPGTAVLEINAFQEVKDQNDVGNSVSLSIISWKDTEIQFSSARCRETVTVNALFGSAARDQ